jgi:exodeoxyribonuclease V gamma subunit
MHQPGFRAVLAPTLPPLRTNVLERLGAMPLPPLETEIVFVQSLGMRQWLTLQLADAFGCAGSLAMPFPRDLLSSATRWVRAERDGQEHFRREVLTWRIEALLRVLDIADPIFAPITTYLGDGDPRMRSGLAIRVAGRFDDYQLYRPELLTAWEAGNVLTDNPHEPWQAALWRSLTGGPNAPHQARVLDGVLERLRDASTRDLAIPPRLTAFGISALPPRYIELLAALGRHSDVTLYATVPPAGAHPLEVRWGGQGRALQTLLAAHGADITTLGEPLRVRAQVDAHVTHGALREVEVLHDQLLDAFARDPSLRPEDVLVVVPDADRWGAIVETVFTTLREPSQRIPMHVAHRSLRFDPAVQAFTELLALEGGRFSHSEVFSFLQHPMVRTAAGLTDDQVEHVARWTQAANVRWGYDDSTVASFDLPSDDMPTWRRGIDRLLMGVIAGAQDEMVLGVLPTSGSTTGDPDALGAVSVWVDRLAALLLEWKRPRTLAEWSAELVRAAEEFLKPEDNDGRNARTQLLGALRALAIDLPAHDRSTIEFGVVREWLAQELAEDVSGSRVVTGSVTVAEWKPMRSIPFRVIAMTGLDDATFPRRDRPVGFDLIAHAPALGDRSLREDDRQLFLDTVLAAKDRLILSWTGKTASAAAERARSVVIDELLESLAHDGHAVTPVEHPLHPFSPRYFSDVADDAALFTYAAEMQRTVVAPTHRRALVRVDALVPTPVDARATADTETGVDLQDLVSFWENPARWFCWESLRLTLPQDESLEADRERFALDKLQAGLVRYLMLQGTMRGRAAGTEQEQRRLIADGTLPPGALGRAWHQHLAEEFEMVRPLIPDTPIRMATISLQGNGWHLRGSLDGVTDDARYVIRSGVFYAKHRIRAWVEHVVLCAAAQQGSPLPRTSQYLGLAKKNNKKQGAIVSVPERREALGLVDTWVRLLREARSRPLPFFPQAAVEWIDGFNAKRTDHVSRMAKARTAFVGNRYMSGDREDAYINLCFRHLPGETAALDVNEAAFIALATNLLATDGKEPSSLVLPAL